MKIEVFQPVMGMMSRVFLALVFLCSSVFAAEENTEAPSAAKGGVLMKSPQTQSMRTNLMNKTLVQDVVRVGERIFLAGVRGHIGWSDDNGKTWQQAQVPTIQDINALFFASQDVGWAVGHDSNIFNTIDGGKTWTLQLDGIAYNLTRAQERADRYSVELSSKQAEYDEAQAQLEETQTQLEEAQGEAKPNSKQIKTLEQKIAELDEQVTILDDEVYELNFQVRDAESILSEENAPWPLMDVWFRDLNTGFAVGAFNALLMTKDGGKTWENIAPRLDNPDGFHLNAVAGLDSTIVVAGEAGLLFRSIDDGETWVKLKSPDDGSFYAIHIEPGIAPVDAAGIVTAPALLDIIVTGLEGYVYRSNDSGASWKPMEHPLRYNLNNIYMDKASGLLLMVGNDGAVVYSTDGGATLQTHRLESQITMSSATVAADGKWVLAGAAGIVLVSPEFKN